MVGPQCTWNNLHPIIQELVGRGVGRRWLRVAAVRVRARGAGHRLVDAAEERVGGHRGVRDLGGPGGRFGVCRVHGSRLAALQDTVACLSGRVHRPVPLRQHVPPQLCRPGHQDTPPSTQQTTIRIVGGSQKNDADNQEIRHVPELSEDNLSEIEMGGVL